VTLFNRFEIGSIHCDQKTIQNQYFFHSQFN
jgi:hypothetical protein